VGKIKEKQRTEGGSWIQPFTVRSTKKKVTLLTSRPDEASSGFIKKRGTPFRPHARSGGGGEAWGEKIRRKLQGGLSKTDGWRKRGTGDLLAFVCRG